MPDLTSFSNQLDNNKLECRAIIETPKYLRNKFDYDLESHLFKLAGLLPEGMMVRIIGVIEAQQTEHGKTDANHRLLEIIHDGVRAFEQKRKSQPDIRWDRG